MRRVAGAAAVVAALAALTGCGASHVGQPVAVQGASVAAQPTFPPPTFTLHGVFRVSPDYFTCPGCEDSGGLPLAGAECWTYGALRNVVPGTTVRITDGAGGLLLGLGRLGDGYVATDPDYPGLPQWCVFDFTAPNVPQDQKFYTVQVGGVNPVEFREDEVRPGTVVIVYK